MKYLNFCFLILIVSACSEKKKENPIVKDISYISAQKKTDFENPALTSWELYYQKNNLNFSFENFKKMDKVKTFYTDTSDPSLLNGTLEAVYKPFLIYSPDRTKYIDFDSYQWSIGEDGKASFEADQKVVLVDMKNKTQKQIAFYGPSFWIEEGFWKNNNELVLLGNTYEKVPFYTEYNFRDRSTTTYQYPDTLIFEKSYANFRIKKFNIERD